MGAPPPSGRFFLPSKRIGIANFMRLMPGDVIATGTPEGAGLGLDPPQFLKLGDVVDLSISGLGTQRQTVVSQPT